MPSGTLETVKERTDIVELIGRTVQLRQAGRSFKGLCPFHNEKTPSFVVYPDSQSFHCFGCGKSGDAFSFVMQTENVDFRDALKQLAERAGVELESRIERKDPERDRVRERLVELNERAAAFFANALWNSPAGAAARALLERRGVDRRAAERFGLGFAPDSFDALKGYFTSRDVGEQELIDAGLLSTRDDGRSWDRFRNRITFPIRDREGHTVGFGARALGDEKPKYLNTAQTAIFDKRSLLYALDKAYDDIRRQRAVVIVEGYMDAIAAHLFGFDNVVASMGTAVTPTQVSSIRRYVDRVYLALDADAAGQMATLRGIDALRDSFADEERVEVKPQNPVRFERTIGAEIRIVEIPHGKDPDELIRHDVEAWRAALDGATPLVAYYLTHALADVEPTPMARAKALTEVAVPILREIGDAAVLAQYVGMTSRLLDFKDTDVHSAVLRGVSRRPEGRVAPPRLDERPAVSDPERYLVSLALRSPWIALPRLAEIDRDDVLDARNRELLAAIEEAEGDSETLQAGLSPELHEYAAELVASVVRPGESPGVTNHDIGQAIRRLAQTRHQFRLRQVQTDIEQARRDGDQAELAEQLRRMTLLALRKPQFDPSQSPYFKDTRSAVS
jgi:DNA primase